MMEQAGSHLAEVVRLERGRPRGPLGRRRRRAGQQRGRRPRRGTPPGESRVRRAGRPRPAGAADDGGGSPPAGDAPRDGRGLLRGDLRPCGRGAGDGARGRRHRRGRDPRVPDPTRAAGEEERLIDSIVRSGRPVVSLDLPSGIDPDTGRGAGSAITATATLTLALPKPGLVAAGTGRSGRPPLPRRSRSAGCALHWARTRRRHLVRRRPDRPAGPDRMTTPRHALVQREARAPQRGRPLRRAVRGGHAGDRPRDDDDPLRPRPADPVPGRSAGPDPHRQEGPRPRLPDVAGRQAADPRHPREGHDPRRHGACSARTACRRRTPRRSTRPSSARSPRTSCAASSSAIPTIGVNIIRHLSRRLDAAERELEAMAYQRVDQRLARKLLDLAGRFGVATARGTLIGARLTQQELAEMIGTTRETLAHTLGDFRRRGPPRHRPPPGDDPRRRAPRRRRGRRVTLGAASARSRGAAPAVRRGTWSAHIPDPCLARR
jgi:hypothetical protein